MKPTLITMLVLFCVLAIGCQEENMEKAPDEQMMNTKLINTYSDIAIQNAIISEHMIYPYHFVKDGAELNGLGQRDLAVLGAHLGEHGGHLNIRRHGVSAELYEARVVAVRETLQETGIDMERINISDGMPGGSGMPSESVLIILEQEWQITGTETSTTSTSN